VQVRSFLLLPTMSMGDVSGKSKPMRVGHRIRIHRLRDQWMTFSSRAKRMY
jgi:hypothetical protein